MFVRRKRSNKRKRKFYEAVSFCYSDLVDPISRFLDKHGEIITGMMGANHFVDAGTIIKLVDGRIITPNQILLKDQKGKIISFDSTIFYIFFDVWQSI